MISVNGCCSKQNIFFSNETSLKRRRSDPIVSVLNYLYRIFIKKMASLHANWNFCLICRILVLVPAIVCYNVDTEFPILYKGTSNDYFGYSVGLLRNAAGNRALITAPKANSSVVTGLHQPGALFSCSISLSNDDQSCEEVAVDKRGNVPKTNYTNGHFSYKNKRDDMWLGVSLDIQRGSSQDKDVVVCGHLWKDQDTDEQYFVNGVCYVINSDLNTDNVKKLVPFVHKRKQVIDKTSFYAFAQAGTSVTFSEDGKYLLLGSPGFFEGAGTIVSYKLSPQKEEGLDNPIIPFASQDYQSSGYAGYSVTSGKFFSRNVTYSAVGAPRDGNYRGRVYILEPVDKNLKKLITNETKEGVQFGEYFGASVSGIDLNNDGLTDLLVGAPFYSEASGGDEGRVYVYVSKSNGEGLDFFATLSGQNKVDARFGTSIGDIGDLNQDGFNDVAVGAPYEDENGAVYIYHGTREGLNTKYAQRIGAEELGKTGTTISGFGISISRGLDIDDNSYLDLLVGSYSSSNAVLLRTHPVIQISSELKFDPPKINRNVTKCRFEGEKLPCFNITYCLQYSGKHAPSSLDFKTELKMDYPRQRNNDVRGFLLIDDQPLSSVTRNMKLDVGQSGSCFREIAYINGNITDEITPVHFFLSYDLDYDMIKVDGNETFCKNCPVIDSNSPTNITKVVPFLVDCGPDNRCLADLVLKIRVLENPNNDVLIIGQKSTLTLEVTISNQGETAYAPVLSIQLPSEVSIVKKDLCDIQNEVHEQGDNTTLRCDLSNSIKKSQKAAVNIKIDMKRIPVTATSLNIYFEVTTVSEEVNEADNTLNFPMLFKAQSDIGITGFPEDSLIPYTAEKTTAPVTHTYYVQNYGPSPVDQIDIHLKVPFSINGRNGWVDFLIFDDFEVDGSETAVIPKCSSSHFNLRNISITKSKRNALDENQPTAQETETVNVADSRGIEKRSVGGGSTAERGDRVLDCDTAECANIHCVAGPFPSPQKFTKIVFSVHLNLTVLNNAMDTWNAIEYITTGEISSGREQVVAEKYPDSVKVRTVVGRPGPPPPREIEKWIIFVSVGIGILLLIIILITLVKIGFFKRQQRDKMKSMMFQAEMKESNRKLSSDEEEEEEPTENKPLNDVRVESNET